MLLGKSGVRCVDTNDGAWHADVGQILSAMQQCKDRLQLTIVVMQNALSTMKV